MIKPPEWSQSGHSCVSAPQIRDKKLLDTQPSPQSSHGPDRPADSISLSVFNVMESHTNGFICGVNTYSLCLAPSLNCEVPPSCCVDIGSCVLIAAWHFLGERVVIIWMSVDTRFFPLWGY